jgi:integrase
MASIVLLKKKKGSVYRAVVRREGKTLTKCFERKTDAKVWAQKEEQKIRDGINTPKTRKHTLADAITRYEKEVLPRKAKRFQKVQRSQLNWFTSNYGTLKLSQLEKDILSEAKEKLLNEDILRGENTIKRSPSTVNRYFQLLNHLLNTCKNDWGWIHDVPRISKLKEPQGRTKVLSLSEMAQFRHHLTQYAPEDVRLICLISISLGSRLEETCALSWADVNLDDQFITFTKTKTGQDRTVPIPNKLHNEITKWRNQRGAEGLLFPADLSAKKPYIYEKVRKYIKRAAAKLNIKEFTFHTFRHTFASIAAQQGTNRKGVKDMVNKICSDNNFYTNDGSSIYGRVGDRSVKIDVRDHESMSVKFDYLDHEEIQDLIERLYDFQSAKIEVAA